MVVPLLLALVSVSYRLPSVLWGTQAIHIHTTNLLTTLDWLYTAVLWSYISHKWPYIVCGTSPNMSISCWFQSHKQHDNENAITEVHADSCLSSMRWQQITEPYFSANRPTSHKMRLRSGNKRKMTRKYLQPPSVIWST